MTSDISYEEKFAKSFSGFMDFGESILKECYEKKSTTLSPNGIGYAIGFANGKVKDKGHKWLIEEFIKKTNADWPKAHECNADHFVKKLKDLLPILEDNHVKELTRVFTTEGILSTDDKEAFWEHIHSFIKLSIKYVHVNRKPVKTDEGFKYTVNFLTECKVKAPAELFKVKLVV
jgi:hypothetical protein